jgi:hypothetical protein
MKGLRIALFAALAALLVSCGGGTGGTGVSSNPPTPSSAISIGVMTKGSVIVNGVHFDDSNASSIEIDDTPKTSTALQSGMVVKVAGTVNSDGTTGSAQQVRALIEVRGIPDQVSATQNPPNLRVLNQIVFVDGQTIYSGLNGIADITQNVTLIEVHGLRDSTGRIRATRIEANQAQMGDATVDEIRGVVSNLNTNSNPVTFNLGSQAVAVANGATFLPNGTTIANVANGSVVEVHCSARPNCVNGGAFQASVIEVEDHVDQAFQPGNGEQFEVEGLISGFTTTAFFVAGTPVTLTNGTIFEGGLVTDLGNDVQVEAEGSFDGTTLVATKIEFKRSVIRLQGTTANATANSFDMQIANGTITISVQVDSFTTGTIPVNGTCVQVRGQRKLPTPQVVVIAGEIDSCSGNRDFIQAPVEAKTAPTSITLLATPIDVSNPGDGFMGLSGGQLTPTQFFDTITVSGVDSNGIPQAGTLVKVTFNTGTSQIHEVEIEDEQ